MKRILIFLLGLYLMVEFVLPGIAVCGAAVPSNSISLEITGVGTMLVPAWLQVNEAKNIDGIENINAQYDMTGLQQDTYHYARTIIYKDNKDMGLAADLFNYVEFKEPLLQMASDTLKGTVERTLESNGAKLLQWYPIQKAAMGKQNAFLLEARLIATDKLPLPMFADIYVTVKDRHLTGVGFLCPDSDRMFWQPIFKQMVSQIQ